jgi:hypothetical protein
LKKAGNSHKNRKATYGHFTSPHPIDPKFRKLSLYPDELRAHALKKAGNSHKNRNATYGHFTSLFQNDHKLASETVTLSR